MKKLKWFTLVEILIVIVIIGILIAALLPRMSAVQWRARDVARKNDLSQIQSTLIWSYNDRWHYPELDGAAKKWVSLEEIQQDLFVAGMDTLATDPVKSNKFRFWADMNTETTEWNYWYILLKKNGIANAWFAVIAKPEVEWWANWVMCDADAEDPYAGNPTKFNWSLYNYDVKYTKPCTDFVFNNGGGCFIEATEDQYDQHKIAWWAKCHYNDINQLRYIVLY